MLTSAIKRAMLRDLTTFAAELDAYPDDASVWLLPKGCSNSTGTLTLHAAGNLRHFVGGVLGNSGYVRDRDAEFSARDLPRTELEMLLALARDEVGRALDLLPPDALTRNFPLQVGGVTLATGVFLVHLATHLSYHLGQADIHRRIVTGEARGLGAVSPAAMADSPPA